MYHHFEQFEQDTQKEFVLTQEWYKEDSWQERAYHFYTSNNHWCEVTAKVVFFADGEKKEFTMPLISDKPLGEQILPRIGNGEIFFITVKKVEIITKAKELW